jgi:hypothetical protein
MRNPVEAGEMLHIPTPASSEERNAGLARAKSKNKATRRQNVVNRNYSTLFNREDLLHEDFPPTVLPGIVIRPFSLRLQCY